MTVNNTDLVAAVSKLNDRTRRKLQVWSPGSISDAGRSVISTYYTPYEGRIFRLTELAPSSGERRYDKNPKNRYKLEILDEQNALIFEFPDVQGISDLFSSVRARQTDVDELIKSLISS